MVTRKKGGLASIIDNTREEHREQEGMQDAEVNKGNSISFKTEECLS